MFNFKMTHRLVSYNPNSACAVPERHLGQLCEIIEEHERLGTVTVAFYDQSTNSVFALMVDKECAERI